MKRDIADEETEKALKEIENQISKEYAQAEKEIAKKLDDYLKKFEVKDELKRKALANGLITEEEYKQWRVGQIMIGQRWTEMRNTLAQDLTNADKIARSIAFEHMPYVYAINHDYSTFLIEKASKLDTSYTLYDRHAMEQLVKDADTFIPAPGRKVKRDIKEGKALAWNNKLVQSAMMQSLLQGEAIPDIATRLAKTVGESDRKAAIRNARTLTTGIENAGRIASYKQANEIGIETQKQWLATLDSRTRHWHASLDGATVDYDEPFENELGEIMFPGDPFADPGNIFNCRCTLIPSIKGFERDVSDMDLRHDDHLGDMTYDEWKKGHYEQTSDPITKQDTVSEIMKWKHEKEYEQYRIAFDDGYTNQASGVDNSSIASYTVRTKEEITEATEQLKDIVEQYSDNPSLWSGQIVIDNKMLDEIDATGLKAWDCEIVVKDDVGDGTIIHELFHSCSGNYYGLKGAEKYRNIEEGSVEYMTQIICQMNNIYKPLTYAEKVRTIADLRIPLGYEDDLTFAKELFNIPLPKRYKWLEKKTLKALKKSGAYKRQYKETMAYLEKLKGGSDGE